MSRAVWPEAFAHAGSSRVLAHEWFTNIGGSDRVAARLADTIDADVVYTFALDRELVARLGITRPVVTWRFGERLSRSGRFRRLVPLMPLIWRALDLSEARVVVTSSHSCVNAISASDARRVSYVHTPMRYAWMWRLERHRLRPALRWMLPIGAAMFRFLDRRWSSGVDVFIANSATVANRIARFYDRTAAVVHPPIDVDFWHPADAAASGADDDPPFVVAGRLVAYKRPDVAVDAATRSSRQLVVAGGGPSIAELRRRAGPSVMFIEDPTDVELRAVLRSAKALLFPGVEDFGMLPVEAQACGTPVLALGDGGALETVIPGVTGDFVDGDDVGRWAAALARFDVDRFDREAIRRHAERFSTERFDREIATAFDRRSDRP